MKLLVLTNNPERSSYRQRIGVYLDIFKSEGLETTEMVLASSLFERIRQYRKTDTYDVVFLHKKCLNAVDGLFFNPHKCVVIFNYDDAIMYNEEDQATVTHQKRFQRSLKKASKVLVGSSYLANQARPFHKDITVLPLGLRIDDYNPTLQKINDGKLRLVWIGSAATTCFIKSLTPVIQHLAVQYPNLVLRVIGDQFIDMEGVAIENIQWTQKTRSHSLGECDIGLAPLLDTQFTRGKCSFKVLEYSASGLPVVASPVGTNSEHVQDGKTGYLVRTDSEWYHKISELIDNRMRRIEMGQNGRAFAKEFDISIVGKKLCQIIIDAASGRSACRSVAINV